jgi:hypothetical protein
MVKLNNKGFAISTILYGLALIALMVILALVTTMATTNKNNSTLVDTIEEELDRLNLTNTSFAYNSSNYSQEYMVTKTGDYNIELWGSNSYASGLTHLYANHRYIFYINNTSYFEDENGNMIYNSNGSINTPYSTSPKIISNMQLSGTASSSGKARISLLNSTPSSFIEKDSNIDQNQRINYVPDGTYYLVSGSSALNLISYDSSSSATNIKLSAFTGELENKWVITRVYNEENNNSPYDSINHYTISPKNNQSLVLSLKSGQARLTNYDSNVSPQNSDQQFWNIKIVSKDSISDYNIKGTITSTISSSTGLAGTTSFTLYRVYE